MKGKIIDRKNGAIRISDTLIISRETTPNELFDYFDDHKIMIRDVKNCYIHYNVQDIPLDETFFNFDFAFHNDRLLSVDMGYDTSGDGWDNWSEEKELNREKKYHNWLSRQVGPARNFTWGVI